MYTEIIDMKRAININCASKIYYYKERLKVKMHFPYTDKIRQ